MGLFLRLFFVLRLGVFLRISILLGVFILLLAVLGGFGLLLYNFSSKLLDIHVDVLLKGE